MDLEGLTYRPAIKLPIMVWDFEPKGEGEYRAFNCAPQHAASGSGPGTHVCERCGQHKAGKSAHMCLGCATLTGAKSRCAAKASRGEGGWANSGPTIPGYCNWAWRGSFTAYD